MYVNISEMTNIETIKFGMIFKDTSDLQVHKLNLVSYENYRRSELILIKNFWRYNFGRVQEAY